MNVLVIKLVMANKDAIGLIVITHLLLVIILNKGKKDFAKKTKIQ